MLPPQSNPKDAATTAIATRGSVIQSCSFAFSFAFSLAFPWLRAVRKLIETLEIRDGALLRLRRRLGDELVGIDFHGGIPRSTTTLYSGAAATVLLVITNLRGNRVVADLHP